MYAKIEAARQLSTVQEMEAAIDDAVAQWRAHSQHDAWFDDCLNQEGAEQAAALEKLVAEQRRPVACRMPRADRRCRVGS